MASSPSPRARQRQSIQKMYRARGRQNHNLWLVYSVKTDRDWVLSSDSELIHWVCNLEAESTVRSFDLTPEAVHAFDANEPRSTELDAVVDYENGRREWHEIKAGTLLDTEPARSQFQAQSAAAHQRGIIYRRFTAAELKPLAPLAVRWLNAIAFAAAIRDLSLAPTTLALLQTLRRLQEGEVNDLLIALALHDRMAVAGLLIRLTLQRSVALDLSEREFGLTTAWRYDGD
jgi:hypothetical protein